VSAISESDVEILASLISDSINEVHEYITAHSTDYAAYLAEEREITQIHVKPLTSRRKSRKSKPPINGV